jgi:hypothetical protein
MVLVDSVLLAKQLLILLMMVDSDKALLAELVLIMVESAKAQLSEQALLLADPSEEAVLSLLILALLDFYWKRPQLLLFSQSEDTRYVWNDLTGVFRMASNTQSMVERKAVTVDTEEKRVVILEPTAGRRVATAERRQDMAESMEDIEERRDTPA